MAHLAVRSAAWGRIVRLLEPAVEHFTRGEVSVVVVVIPQVWVRQDGNILPTSGDSGWLQDAVANVARRVLRADAVIVDHPSQCLGQDAVPVVISHLWGS